MSGVRLATVLGVVIMVASGGVATQSQSAARITSPAQQFGAAIGDDYFLATFSQLDAYWQKLDRESDRIVVFDIGGTSEGRRQPMAVISAPENLRALDRYKTIARRLARAEGLTEEQARVLAAEGKAIVVIAGGLHADETLGAQQLIETVYQFASRDDAETRRLLRDTIVLAIHANPDGHELVANWYMREADPQRRSLARLPRLYQKYVGHDINRDFYMATQAETININRVLFQEWYPQIVYDHHQPAPAGAVMFAPPFRGPINPVLDPLIPAGIDLVARVMHERFAAENKAGITSGEGATYTAWWNGGLRTTPYFHNQIGILTETLGSPTPLPNPIGQGSWHFRQSIDYSLTANRAVLDAASRHRQTLLLDTYRMAARAIEAGSRGTRAYILPANQPDFPTATTFVNALLHNGVVVHRASRAFAAGGRQYAAGSYVVKTAQAFRPHVLDMFEPQKYPDDIPYPGAPPRPPYDNAGWTLAYQMGVKFDRVDEAVEAPLEPITGLATSPVPDRYVVMNRTLKAVDGLTPVGLADNAGGSVPSGWIRWLFERYEFPFEVVTPRVLEQDDLRGYDVIVLPEDVIPDRRAAMRLTRFVEDGGTLVAIGRATAVHAAFGLPISDPVARLPPEKYFVPGSILRARVDTTVAVAQGLESEVDVFFDNSPVFRLEPGAVAAGIRPIAWFATASPLRSGWAWGQAHLKDAVIALEAPVGKGRLILFGPQVTFRAQSHGTFKLLFNSLYLHLH